MGFIIRSLFIDIGIIDYRDSLDKLTNQIVIANQYKIYKNRIQVLYKEKLSLYKDEMVALNKVIRVEFTIGLNKLD